MNFHENLIDMSKYIFCLMSLLFASSAIGGWDLIGKNSDGDPVYFGDFRDLGKNNFEFWYMKEMNNSKQTIKGKKPVSLIWLDQIDCIRGKTRNVYFRITSDKQGTGEVLSLENMPNADWEPLIPNSIQKTVAVAYCK